MFRRINQTISERCESGFCTVVAQRYVVAFIMCLNITQFKTLSLCYETSLLYLIDWGGTNTSNLTTDPNAMFVINDTIPSGSLCTESAVMIPYSMITSQMDFDALFMSNNIYCYTLLITHLPVGLTCDKLGIRNSIIASSIIGVLLSSTYPTILTKSNSFVFLTHRIAQGLLEAIINVVTVHLVSHWTTKDEYTIVLTLCNAGAALGALYHEILTYALLFVRWDIMFYIISASYAITLLLNIYFVYNNPLQSPFASKEEKDKVMQELGEEYPERIPWKQIGRDGSIWALLPGQLGTDIMRIFLFVYISKYLRLVIGINIFKYYYYMIICHIGTVFMPMLWCLLAQYFINKKMMPVLYVRTFSAGLGNIMPFIFVILSTYSGCLAESIIICYTVGSIIRDLSLVGTAVNVLDITRYYSGLIEAITHGIGRGVGGLIVSKMLSHVRLETINDFRLATCAVGSVSMFLTILYYVWADASRAKWDTIETEEDVIGLRLHKRQIQENPNIHSIQF
ncbi:sodium-dependent phosphate transport protein 3-like [Onthophagus taurus]|uniref:sodium-dependent phosphate transport protein 3-like n=1 Tax=Onthophagus taurus TaxID=166361 RepID=UPI0039BEC595